VHEVHAKSVQPQAIEPGSPPRAEAQNQRERAEAIAEAGENKTQIVGDLQPDRGGIWRFDDLRRDRQPQCKRAERQCEPQLPIFRQGSVRHEEAALDTRSAKSGAGEEIHGVV